MSETGAKSNSATADVLRSAFTYLLRPNCGAFGRAVSTSKICEVSTCFIVDSCQTLGGTLHAREATVSFPTNSRGLKRLMPQARSSWIGRPTYCLWRAVPPRSRKGTVRPAIGRHVSNMPGYALAQADCRTNT